MTLSLKKNFKQVAFILIVAQAALLGVADEFFSYHTLRDAIANKNLLIVFEEARHLSKKFSRQNLNERLSKPIERDFKTELNIPHEIIQKIKTSIANPTLGQVLGTLFFPSDSFFNTTKTNFNQFSFFERSLIVIAAELGHQGARNIVILGNEADLILREIHTTEDLSRLLMIPFAAENGAVLQKAKELLSNGAAQNSFLAHISAAPSEVLVNAGYIYKFLKRPDLAAQSFELAKNQGSRRGAIEYGFAILEQGLEKADEFIAILAPLGLEHYAYWKLAQCYRYDSSSPHGVVCRDFAKANKYYVQALPGGGEFPEIFYDAGDFVEYLADFQDPEITGPALQRALEHYRNAAVRGLGEAFRKQVDILKKQHASKEAITYIAHQAAQQYYMHAPDLLKSAGGDQIAIEWVSLAQYIEKYYNGLKYVLSCSLSF